MELKWLEDFVSLARTGSFSRSAEERHVTQPAFSRRIKSLELWLGKPLVDRGTFPTTLTPAGRIFRERAEKLVGQIYSVREEFKFAQQKEKTQVTVAMPHSLALSFFPKWFRPFLEDVCNLTVRVVASNFHDGVTLFMEGHSDFLLCYAHPEVSSGLNPAQFPYLELGYDRLVPVCVPAAGRPKFQLPGSSAAPLPYLAYDEDAFLGKVVRFAQRIHSAPVHLWTRYENAFAEALKEMAVEGVGLAWLPESSLAAELAEERLVRCGDGAWEVQLGIRLYKSAKRVSRQIELIWSTVEAQQDLHQDTRAL